MSCFDDLHFQRDDVEGLMAHVESGLGDYKSLAEVFEFCIGIYLIDTGRLLQFVTASLPSFLHIRLFARRASPPTVLLTD